MIDFGKVMAMDKKMKAEIREWTERVSKSRPPPPGKWHTEVTDTAFDFLKALLKDNDTLEEEIKDLKEKLGSYSKVLAKAVEKLSELTKGKDEPAFDVLVRQLFQLVELIDMVYDDGVKDKKS